MRKTALFLIPLFFLSIIAMNISSCGLASGGNTNSASNFTLVASWTGSSGEFIHSVVADGTNVYSAAGSDGLYIFSSDLTYMSSFVSNNPVKDLVVRTYGSKKYAVAANGIYNGNGGIMMINVQDLTNLQLTNYSEYPNLNPNVLVADDSASNVLTADQFSGYKTYTNAWDTLNNFTNKVLSMGGSPGADIAVSGTKAYVAAKTGGVYIIDISGNTVSAQITTTLLLANAVAVSGSGDGTLLAVGDNLGLIVFNMDAPDSSSKPRYIGGYYGQTVYDVVIDGNDFYLALGPSGVIKLRRTPPTTFTLEKQYNDGASYYKLFYYSSTGNIYAACGKDGIRILR